MVQNEKPSSFSSEMVWIKCNNKACKAKNEMGKREFYKQLEANVDATALSPPSLTCEKCGKPNAFAAVKCANPDCGVVFFKDSVPNDFSDRCPKCGQSA